MTVSKSVTIPMGSLLVTVDVTYRVIPGEPAVRYYADGSGYPGSDSQVDCIDHVEVIEIEYPTGSDGLWDCKDRHDLGDCAVVADRWAYDDLASGKYDDELLEYDGSDDYDE
jgi:hypothetical protein